MLEFGDPAADRHEEATVENRKNPRALQDDFSREPRKPTPSRTVPSGRPWTPAEDERVLAGAPKDDEALARELDRKGTPGLKKRRTILRKRAAAEPSKEPERGADAGGAGQTPIADTPITAAPRLGPVDKTAGGASGPAPTRPAELPTLALGNDEGSPAETIVEDTPPSEPTVDEADAAGDPLTAEDGEWRREGSNPRTPWRSYGTFTRRLPAQQPAAPISRDAELEQIERRVAEGLVTKAYRPPDRPPFERVPIPQSHEPRPPAQAAETAAIWEPIRQPTEEEKMRGR